MESTNFKCKTASRIFLVPCTSLSPTCIKTRFLSAKIAVSLCVVGATNARVMTCKMKGIKSERARHLHHPLLSSLLSPSSLSLSVLFMHVYIYTKDSYEVLFFLVMILLVFSCCVLFCCVLFFLFYLCAIIVVRSSSSSSCVHIACTLHYYNYEQLGLCACTSSLSSS